MRRIRSFPESTSSRIERDGVDRGAGGVGSVRPAPSDARIRESRAARKAWRRTSRSSFRTLGEAEVRPAVGKVVRPAARGSETERDERELLAGLGSASLAAASHQGRRWWHRRRREMPWEPVGLEVWLQRAGVVILVAMLVAGGIAAIQLSRGIPTPGFAGSRAKLVVPGAPPSLPWPSQGEASLEVTGVGRFGSVGGSTALPIASLTKIMTALVILKDHPLTNGAQGPTLTITASDAAAYKADLAQQDSVAAVAAGETLTERQALEALLIPSADNVATILARWDAGSLRGFVAKMNATARAFGLSHTHYQDASGLSARSVSNAAEQLRLASIAMKNPVFAQIVAMPQVTLPVAGTVYNYNYELGRHGIVGVKTGSDGPAGGCYVFAAPLKVGSSSQMIYGSVLGQQGPSILAQAIAAGVKMLHAARGSVSQRDILAKGSVVGYVKAPWGPPVAVRTTKAVSLYGWPGLRATKSVRLSSLSPYEPAGKKIGVLRVTLGSQHASVPLSMASQLLPPTLTWRLMRL